MTLYTERKLSKTDLAKIRKFKHQFCNLQIDSAPIVYEVSQDEIHVGTYILVRLGDSYWRATNSTNDIETDFCNKKNAMYFALFMTRNKIMAAMELKTLDNKLSMLSIEIEHLRYRIKVSHKLHNSWNVDLFEAKLANATDSFRANRALIKKWFTQAKYYKIQELQL